MGSEMCIRDRFVAWLNRNAANSSARSVHVTLPAGIVLRGDAKLTLPVGLYLVLQGAGADATALNLESKNLDIGGMLGSSGRIEFRNMSITNVRTALSA